MYAPAMLNKPAPASINTTKNGIRITKPATNNASRTTATVVPVPYRCCITANPATIHNNASANRRIIYLFLLIYVHVAALPDQRARTVQQRVVQHLQKFLHIQRLR